MRPKYYENFTYENVKTTQSECDFEIEIKIKHYSRLNQSYSNETILISDTTNYHEPFAI